MNNTLTAVVGMVGLAVLDETSINPMIAAPLALVIGFVIAWRLTRRRA